VQLRREVDDIVLCDSLSIKRSGLGWKGLGPGCFLAGHSRLGTGSLFDGPYRLARDAIEDIAEALLAHLGDSLHRLSVHANINQIGCRWEVIVPQPVMGHLKVPNAMAGPRIEADQTVPEEAVAGTVDSVVIV
jgi:hypothetical protein